MATGKSRASVVSVGQRLCVYVRVLSAAGHKREDYEDFHGNVIT